MRVAFGILFFLGVFFTGSCVILAKLGLSSLMNRLFLRVRRLEPSTLIRTWECGLFSNTTPVLSHLVGLLPVWFWIITGVPTSSISRSLVLWLHFSWSASLLSAKVLSLYSCVTTQSLHGSYLCGRLGRKSLIVLPNTI